MFLLSQISSIFSYAINLLNYVTALHLPLLNFTVLEAICLKRLKYFGMIILISRIFFDSLVLFLSSYLIHEEYLKKMSVTRYEPGVP